MTRAQATATAQAVSLRQGGTFYVVAGNDGQYGLLSVFQYDGIALYADHAWPIIAIVRDGAVIR